MQLTEEQKRVVRSTANTLGVDARAGCAKTSTLRAYAEARPKKKHVYIAFNKSIQLEAAATMPLNVVSRTSHSLAYRKALQLFGSHTREKVGNTYPSAVARALDCSVLAAVGALQTIQRWCSSMDDEIELKHVPTDIAARVGKPAAIAEVARELWRRTLDPNNYEMKASYDSYLKLYAMDRPILEGYETWLVDEWQDTYPPTIAIVTRQPADLGPRRR